MKQEKNPREDKVLRQEDIDRAQVRLRPILGIKPRIWLPALYSAVILLILYLILIAPGVARNGTTLVFQGAPLHSAVYADGAYLGYTDQKLFIPKGEHAISIRHQGFAPSNRTISVKGRIFASLIFPRTQKLSFTLSADSVKGVLDSAFADFSEWTATGAPSAIYQIPSVLPDAALGLLSTGSLSVSALETAALPSGWEKSFALDSLAESTSPQAARDALRAGVMLRAQGPVSPLTLLASVRNAVSALCATPYGAVWLNEMIQKPQSAPEKQIASASSTALSGVSSALSAQPASSPRVSGGVAVAGTRFVSFTSGLSTLAGVDPSGNFLPYTAKIPAFALADTEVTRQQWMAFLSANPQWGLAHKQELISRSLVDDSYLSGWTSAKSSALPVTNVSYYAAQAYCDWLTKVSGYQVVLPTESMWEAAAVAGGLAGTTAGSTAVWSDRSSSGPLPVASLRQDRAGLYDMLGNVWEWTSDSYFPYPCFAAGKFSSDLKAVRGGSWANSSDTVSYSSRGGIPAAHSSEFLGFRPAILVK